jgi:hypothetical protein
VLWLVVAAALVLLWLARKRAPFGAVRFGWLLGALTLAAPLLAARFGGATLLAMAPIVVGLAWRLVQQRRLERGAGPGRPAEARSGRAMTRAEALGILGLCEGASREDILAAHRSLIKKLHPDHGGSGFLAQQVNEAKKVLES